jgi:hypothetical protein
MISAPGAATAVVIAADTACWGRIAWICALLPRRQMNIARQQE